MCIDGMVICPTPLLSSLMGGELCVVNYLVELSDRLVTKLICLQLILNSGPTWQSVMV